MLVLDNYLRVVYPSEDKRAICNRHVDDFSSSVRCIGWSMLVIQKKIETLQKFEVQ